MAHLKSIRLIKGAPTRVFIVGLLGFASLGVCQQPNRQGTPLSTVSGIVLNANDSQPIEGALVIISSEPPDVVSIEPMVARTGSDGRFSISNFSSPQYRITSQKPGFMTLTRLITHAAGNSTRGLDVDVVAAAALDLRMIPQAVIAGQITDSLGQPLAGATVRLSRVHLEGRKTKLSTVAQASTDDVGKYRIFSIEPGRYYVSASFQDASASLGLRQRSAEEGAPGVVTEDYAVVYYPGGPDAETATPLKLRGGEVASNVDMRIGLVPSFQVGGTVSGLPAGVSPLGVFLRPAGGATLGAMRVAALAPGDSHFRFKSVPRGNYILSTQINLQGQVLTARDEVSVSSAISGVSLELQAPFSIGCVVAAEDGHQVLSSIRLKLQGVDSGMQVDLKPDANGRFQVLNATPDEYTIAAADGDGKMFVKSLLLDDSPVSQGGVAILGPRHNLRIVVSSKGARISGVAMDSSQHPVGRGLAVLVSADPADSQSYAVALDAEGKFKFQSLRPGTYRILCFSDLFGSDDATWDVQRRVKERGKDISIGEDEAEQLSIEVTQLDPI